MPIPAFAPTLNDDDCWISAWVDCGGGEDVDEDGAVVAPAELGD